MFKTFEEITDDIGSELKLAAEKIYRGAVIACVIFALIEFIAAFIVSINIGSFLAFLGIGIGIIIEIVCFMAAAYLIVIILYAKGEKVHLLQTIAESTKKEVEKPSEPVLPVTKSPYATRTAAQKKPNVSSNSANWVCVCGRENAQYVSTCYCGVSKREVKKILEDKAAAKEAASQASE